MPSGDFAALHEKLAGEVVTPDDPTYVEVRDGRLAMFHHRRPQAVVRAYSASDVAETLAFAKERGIELRPRSGGHCFAGRSSTDGIVLDVGPMWGIAVEGERATIGAGAILRTIHEYLGRRGRALNLGCGKTVGIAGLTLGGGTGLLGRAYGLTCDQLVGATVVLADGRIVRVDEQHHEDLFWALRGAGGGQFGVVTEFTFRTIDDPLVTRFELTFPHESAHRVIAGWQYWAPDSPDGMNAHLRLVDGPFRNDRPVLILFGLHLGTAAETERMLAHVGAPWAMRGLDEFAYWKVKPTLSGVGATDFYEPDVERSRSEFFAEPLPEEAIVELVERFARGREEGTRRELNFTPWGGAYNRKAASDTAFVHRDARFLLEHLQQTPSGSADTWVDESWQITHPFSTGGVYPNFPDPDLDDPLTAYHGANKERLQAVKRHYDPAGFFAFPQSL
jgi:FAD/FMN-containing dehydrogenase